MMDGLLATGIPSSVEDKACRQFFEKYGSMKHFNCLPDKFNKDFKICYVGYHSQEDAEKAIAGSDKNKIFGEPMKVSAKSMRERPTNNHQMANDRSFSNTDRNPGDRSFSNVDKNSGDRSFSNVDKNTGDRSFSNVDKNTGDRSFSTIDKGSLSGMGSKIARQPSASGRGRGFVKTPPRFPANERECYTLETISVPIRSLIPCEIIEMTDLNNFQSRPILLTEKSKSEISSILGKINSDPDSLRDVDKPKVGSYYLAKWSEDSNFYRAKLMEIQGSSYLVCFVDEGNSDTVMELKELTRELSSFPCQFIQCTLDCSPVSGYIDYILAKGAECELAIFISNDEKIDNKYVVNMFLGGEDSHSLFKEESGNDPRRIRLPREAEIKTHPFEVEVSNFQLITLPQRENDVFKAVILEEINLKSEIKSLDSLPMMGDLVIYRQTNGILHRAVVHSINLKNIEVTLSVRLIDEDRIVESSVDTFFKSTPDCLNIPPRVIKCVLQSGSLKHDIIKIINYDSKKDVYNITTLDSTSQGQDSIIGKEVEATLSHIESHNEFYVLFVEDQSKLEKIAELLNDYNGTRVQSIKELKLGQLVVAPFQDILYRAEITEIDAKQNKVKVLFVDYGNSDFVTLNNVLLAKDQVVRIKPLACPCQLNVKCKSQHHPEVDELLQEYTASGEAFFKLKVEDVNEDNRFLRVNLTAKDKSSFIDILKFKKFVEPNIPNGNVDKRSLVDRLHDLELRVSHLEKSFKH